MWLHCCRVCRRCRSRSHAVASHLRSPVLALYTLKPIGTYTVRPLSGSPSQDDPMNDDRLSDQHVGVQGLQGFMSRLARDVSHHASPGPAPALHLQHVGPLLEHLVRRRSNGTHHVDSKLEMPSSDHNRNSHCHGSGMRAAALRPLL